MTSLSALKMTNKVEAQVMQYDKSALHNLAQQKHIYAGNSGACAVPPEMTILSDGSASCKFQSQSNGQVSKELLKTSELVA